MELAAPFKVESLSELELLQRALLEARFFANGSSEVPASPLVAALHDKCVSRMVEHFAAVGDADALERLNQWRLWRNRLRERVALVAILRGEVWDAWDEEQRFGIAKSLIVPFVATDEEVWEFVREVSSSA